MPSFEQRPKTLRKVLLVGPAGSGKTSMISQWVDKKFSETYKATIPIDFVLKEQNISNQPVTLQVWDTSGQERFESLGVVFYREADVAFVVVDVNNIEHLDKISNLINHVRLQSNNNELPIIIVGNKTDLDSENKIKPCQVEEIIKEKKCLGYMECSATNYDDVNAIFQKALDHLFPASEEDNQEQPVDEVASERTSFEPEAPLLPKQENPPETKNSPKPKTSPSTLGWPTIRRSLFTSTLLLLGASLLLLGITLSLGSVTMLPMVVTASLALLPSIGTAIVAAFTVGTLCLASAVDRMLFSPLSHATTLSPKDHIRFKGGSPYEKLQGQNTKVTSKLFTSPINSKRPYLGVFTTLFPTITAVTVHAKAAVSTSPPMAKTN